MNEQEIKITGLRSASLDAANPVGAYRAYDCFIDDQGFLNKRPGVVRVTQASTHPSGIPSGLLYYPAGAKMMIFMRDHMYTMTGSTLVEAITGADIPVGCTSTTRHNAVLCRHSGEEKVAFCDSAGSAICVYKISSATSLTKVTDADAPSAKYLTYIDGYLIAAGASTNKFYFSAIEDPFTWSALDFVTITQSSSNINGLAALDGKLYVFGDKTIEVFYNDGVAPWVRIDAGLSTVGCIAPLSVLTTDYGIFFLDGNRRVSLVQGDGSIVQLSTPLDSLIWNGVVNDAYFQYCIVRGQEWVLCYFPSLARSGWDGGTATGICLAYDLKSKQWFDWTTWDGTKRLMFDSAFVAPYSNYSMVLRPGFTDAVGFLVGSQYQDDTGDAASQTIHTEWHSGQGSWNTGRRKRVGSMRCRSNATSAANTFNISAITDDGTAANAGTLTRAVSTVGTDLGVKEHRLGRWGSYRVRRYKVDHAANLPFVFGQLAEVLDVQREQE